MKQIGYAGKFGELYDGPGGSGGGYMIPITVDSNGMYRKAALGEWSVGWARNPDYPAAVVGASWTCSAPGGGGGSSTFPSTT